MAAEVVPSLAPALETPKPQALDRPAQRPPTTDAPSPSRPAMLAEAIYSSEPRSPEEGVELAIDRSIQVGVGHQGSTSIASGRTCQWNRAVNGCVVDYIRVGCSSE